MEGGTKKGFHFLNEIDEHLSCPICLNVLQSPIICRNGHTICTKCFVLGKQQKCPVCQCNMNLKTASRGLLQENLVAKLLVKCEHGLGLGRMSCEWTGTYAELPQHWVICDFVVISCIHSGCSQMCIRSEMDAHVTACAFREILCTYCNSKLRFMDMPVHQTKCPAMEVLCPKGCGKSQHRDQLKSHFLLCSEVRMVCKRPGCNQIFKRRDLEVHEAEQATAHAIMGLLEQQKAEFTEKIEQLTREIESLRHASLRRGQVSVPFEFTFTQMSRKLAGESGFFYTPKFTVDLHIPYFWRIYIIIKPESSSLGIGLELKTSRENGPEFPQCIDGSYLTLWSSDKDHTRTLEYEKGTCFSKESPMWGWDAFVSDVRPFINNDSILIKGTLKMQETIDNTLNVVRGIYEGTKS